MNTFDIIASLGGEDFELTLDSSLNSLEDIKDETVSLYKTEHEDDEDFDEDRVDELEFQVLNWGDVPECFIPEGEDDELLTEFLENYCDSNYDVEVFEAAHACDISMSDVEDCYQGEYSSDEDFARETADQIGAVDKNLNWPYTCIDWEYAAKELMYDYCEDNGHYFRNN